MTVARQTQEVIEVVSNTNPPARVTQVVIEVISSSASGSEEAAATNLTPQAVVAT